MYRSWIQISVLHTVLSFNYYNLHTRAQPGQKMFLGLKSPAKAPKIEIHSQKPQKKQSKTKRSPCFQATHGYSQQSRSNSQDLYKSLLKLAIHRYSV